ncbi:hypothetical protein [Fuerstiella marisgermanici]|uniref:hypothetical protein n=1 Tax=Fuerstiella marisgermanici TaxID=1891926 RepID=UPI001C54E184|nr:hypothetical protein [Fuerstiella marisgermanici]
MAFDATRASVTDVDCPIDVAVIANGHRKAKFHRFTQEEITGVTEWWSRTLSDALLKMPMDWASVLF